MNLGLDGKLCLVAGATRGIGRAIALALAREGGRVAAVARGEEGLAAVLRELDAAGGGPHAAIAADVITAEGASAAVDGCARQLGGIDVVIPVVGKSFAREVSGLTDDDLARSLDHNLWSAARVALRAVPHLEARGGGSITMIASIWGREAGGAPGYNAAKAAVIALAKALARDLARRGIRVNSIAPGYVGTPMVKGMDQGALANIVKGVNLGRLIEPEEIADAIAWGSANDAVNATCLEVTGGMITGMIAK